MLRDILSPTPKKQARDCLLLRDETNKEVFSLYEKYRNSCDSYFGSLDGLSKEAKFYVYAWHTITNPPHYFYVGKGTGNRYNHIIKEIEDYEKQRLSGPKATRAHKYSLLQDEYGIMHRIMLDKLSEKEALVYEYCLKQQFTENGEVLLDEEGSAPVGDIGEILINTIEQNLPGPRLEADSFLEHYKISTYKLKFDSVTKDILSKVWFYPYFFEDTEESIKKRATTESFIASLGGKVNKSITDKTPTIIIQGRLPQEVFEIYKAKNKNIVSIDDVLDLAKPD